MRFREKVSLYRVGGVSSIEMVVRVWGEGGFFIGGVFS